jgi:WS/DGAT C-terminal domain
LEQSGSYRRLVEVHKRMTEIKEGRDGTDLLRALSSATAVGSHMAPTSGHIGMSVSIFSYRGEVTVGLMLDAALIPDPDHVVAQLELELETLAGLAA